MKIAKKILASALAFLWLISMSACSAHGKKLTMDAFLKAETRDDIIDLLGEPSSSESGDDYYDHYDSVMYIGDTYSTLVSYYSDSTLCIIVMHYLYDGMRGMDSVLERLDYTVTAKDREAVLAAHIKKPSKPPPVNLQKNTVIRRYMIRRLIQQPTAGMSATARLNLRIIRETTSF